MSNTSLLTAFAGTWASTGPTSAQVVGISFHPTTAGYINRLRWYQQSGNSTDHPTVINIWRVSDGAILGHVNVASAIGAAAWHEVVLPASVPVDADEALIIGGCYPSGSYRAQDTTIGDLPTPGALLAFDDGPMRYQTSNSSSFPDSHAATIPGIDLAFDVVPENTPATAPTTGGDLTAWLSNSSSLNQHQSDGLPWRTDANLTTLKGEAEGTNGFAAIKAVADAIAAVLGSTASTIGAVVTSIASDLTDLTAHIIDTTDASIAAVFNRVADSFDHLVDVEAGHVTFPGASDAYTWTAHEPTDFEDCVTITEAADAYEVLITTLPARLAINDVCGVHVVYRAGWWCELSGGIGGERHFIDFEDTLIRLDNRRMSGILVQLQLGGQGTITPYTLEPA